MSESSKTASHVAQILGRQVRMLRQLAGMTQDDLCERCGIFRTYLSRIENGIVNPTLTVISALSGTLKVQAWELLIERHSKGRPRVKKFATRVTKQHKTKKVREYLVTSRH